MSAIKIIEKGKEENFIMASLNSKQIPYSLFAELSWKRNLFP